MAGRGWCDKSDALKARFRRNRGNVGVEGALAFPSLLCGRKQVPAGDHWSASPLTALPRISAGPQFPVP
jgi:hypothetical protein